MLHAKEQPRAFSAASNLFSTNGGSVDDVDLNKLYDEVMKVVILEYRSEARFRRPLVAPNNGNGPSNSLSTEKGADKYKGHSSSHSVGASSGLPVHTIGSLETKLNYIAMNQTKSNMDKNAIRSLLRMYSELLDPSSKREYARITQPEALVVKFVSCANKELTKIGVEPEDVATSVFSQTNVFVDLLIGIIRGDKRDHGEVIKRLQDYKSSLKPTGTATSLSSATSLVSEKVKYPTPSYRLSDMEAAGFVASLFNVDAVRAQQDVFRLKEFSTEECLMKDVEQTRLLLSRNLGSFNKDDFEDDYGYISWKQRESEGCELLIKRYQPPPGIKLEQPPTLKNGESYYFVPAMARMFLVVLMKKCLENEASDALLSKHSMDLISSCCRLWHVDYPTRAVCFYNACNMSLMAGESPEFALLKDIHHMNRRMVVDIGKMDWNNKRTFWSKQDQDEWVTNISITYSQLFTAVRETLGGIFSSARPRFNHLLQNLGDYVETDELFPLVETGGLTKKWEKKLIKALLRISEMRYAELLTNLPRDNTLNVIHILEIADTIIADIQLVQKRYPNALLGFLNIPKTAASVITGMFAADSKNILNHINAYSKSQGTTIAYSDAMEVYKSLCEIRSIHDQTVARGVKFSFDLELFFFPYVKLWAEESEEKIRNIVEEAVKQDDFQAIDIGDETKKHSQSVVLVFKMISELFRILRELNFKNIYELSKLYTILLKNVSDGVVLYGNRMLERIVADLEDKKAVETVYEGVEGDRRSAAINWFSDVKAAVAERSGLGGGKSLLELSSQPYEFKPETCVYLNNLAEMKSRLANLEEIVDPEMVSETINRYEPDSQKNYTSHLITLRVKRGENLSNSGSIRPYVTLIDTTTRKAIGKTRTMPNDTNPDWDEEFELILNKNASSTVSVTVWDESGNNHSICGRAVAQLDPRRFNNDGIPQDVYLDLDTQGRILVEIAMESERVDAVFCVGRCHRSLVRCIERVTKLIVEKFSRFINLAFSRATLKSVCGSNGGQRPTKNAIDEAIAPLYDYLNSNLEVLAEFLTHELLLKVMLIAWSVVVSSADLLLLPRLTNSMALMNSTSKTSSSSLSRLAVPANGGTNNGGSGWQTAVTSAVANVAGSLGVGGFERPLTLQELDTVFSWLNDLCFDFFHHGGHGPAVEELKNEHYQALLLIPVYYDRDVGFLRQEGERLAPAFERLVRERNGDVEEVKRSQSEGVNGVNRTVSLARSQTIMANGTKRNRARAAREAEEARTDPITAQTAAEDIILRLLIIKDERMWVVRRLEQREKMMHRISTERLAKAAAEGRRR